MFRRLFGSKVEKLQQKAHEALEAGKTKDARVIGQQLLELRHSSGFEIVALAHQQDEQYDEAVAVLREGTSKAPSVWLLWELVGARTPPRRSPQLTAPCRTTHPIHAPSQPYGRRQTCDCPPR